MPPRIKNCGLKTPESIDQALATGASYVGFVYYPSSPRHIELAQMAKLAAHARGRIKTVAVTVDPDDALVDDIAQNVRPDFLQVHKVDRERTSAIAARSKLPLIIGVGIRSAADVALARTLEPLATHLLLDNQHSGSGQAFDWQLIKAMGLSKPWFLAGGLTIENVAEAIRATQAPMVDVSSGLEDSPGNKSLEKIAAFNAAVLNARDE